jgi:hypothetical protein
MIFNALSKRLNKPESMSIEKQNKNSNVQDRFSGMYS